MSKINNAIMENENLTTDEKIFMMSNSYFFLDNKEYINIDKLIRKLKKLNKEKNYAKKKWCTQKRRIA